MQIDATVLRGIEAYHLVTTCVVPRPVAWLSTVDASGRPNLAPFSYFAGVTATPPTVVVSIGRVRGRRKDTAANLLAVGEGVVHIAPRRLAAAMVATSADVPPEVDEFELAGLAKAPSVDVRPPRIADAPIAMEVRVSQHLEVGDGPSDVFFLRIVRFHLDDGIVDADGRPDPVRLDATGRLGGERYCASSDVFEIPRPPRR